MKMVLLCCQLCLLLVGDCANADAQDSLSEPLDVTFVAKADDTEQKYVLVAPPDFSSEIPVDVLIALHGHGSDRWQFVRQDRPECKAVRDVALQHQMLLVSPDYRAKTSWMGPAAEADVVQIISELKEKYSVRRVFLCGASMGGSSCLTFGVLHPELLAGVASMNGTANHLEYQNFQEAISASFGGSKQQIPEEYKKRSAEYWPERFTMPIAFTTGGQDKSVPPESVVRLAFVLKQMGREPLLIHREAGGHSTTYEDAVRILEYVISNAPLPITFLTEWGKTGSEPGEFNFPIGIAINQSDEVFVTDHYNNRIQKFDSEGKLLAHFETLPNPGGIAIDDAGNIYVAHFPAARLNSEMTPDRVSVYDPSGKLLREWGKSGSEDGEFSWPGGLAMSRRNRVYVADQTNRRVQYFDLEGRFLGKWGSYGIETGQFGGNSGKKSRVGGPQFLAIDATGNVYTTEGSVGRVQKFDPDGKFLLAWGDNEDRQGSFGRPFEGTKLQGPVAICFDKSGNVWISAAGGRVQQFTPSGKYLRGIGEKQGTQPGEFRAPHGIAINGHGHLFVVDAYNQRIQKFDLND